MWAGSKNGCVVLAGSGELATALMAHLQSFGVRARQATSEQALDHVWLHVPNLIVGLGDAIADGGIRLRDGLLAEPASATIPLLLLRRGHGERGHDHVATLATNLGERRLAAVIARLARALSESTHQTSEPLQQRLSALLRQVEQEDALLLLSHPGTSTPRLASPIPPRSSSQNLLDGCAPGPQAQMSQPPNSRPATKQPTPGRAPMSRQQIRPSSEPEELTVNQQLDSRAPGPLAQMGQPPNSRPATKQPISGMAPNSRQQIQPSSEPEELTVNQQWVSKMLAAQHEAREAKIQPPKRAKPVPPPIPSAALRAQGTSSNPGTGPSRNPPTDTSGAHARPQQPQSGIPLRQQPSPEHTGVKPPSQKKA